LKVIDFLLTKKGCHRNFFQMNDLVKPQLFSYYLTHFIHYTHILTVLIELFKIKIGQILLYIKRKELQERKMNGEKC
jgi:hypothetical protein